MPLCKISPFDNMGLLELIVKTGIGEAIATRLGKLKDNQEAIAETIENNVRSKIIKEHLNDPAFYEKMSALLDEIIAARKAKALAYEEYLKRIAAVAKKVDAGHADDTPEELKKSRALSALYNNLKKSTAPPPVGNRLQDEREAYQRLGDPALKLALRIDEAVKQAKPDDWRGVETRERVIKKALFDLLQDDDEVERIFLIIFEHRGEY